MKKCVEEKVCFVWCIFLKLWILCDLSIQGFADEIVCLLSQIWIWGFWSVPFAVEEKVCFVWWWWKKHVLGSYCSLYIIHELQLMVLTKLINSTENPPKIMAWWGWDMVLEIYPLEWHLCLLPVSSPVLCVFEYVLNKVLWGYKCFRDSFLIGYSF